MSDLGSLIALPRDEDAFKVYTDMNLWTEVRRFVLVENNSKRSACVKFQIHWKTLNKMLEHPAPPGYRKPKVPRAKKIDKVLPVLHAWLEADRQAPPKQRHTARRLYERLRDEHGFDGGQTVVKDAVRAWKRVHREAYVPLSHPLGEAQVDFGEAVVDLDGERVKVCLFVMSLPYSDAVFVKAYPRECTEAFHDGHVEAFAFFGGVPRRISYDNTRIAVTKITGPHERELTEAFLRLQSYYLFEAHFCRVRRANEKGHVENLVGYGRRNFLTPVPSVRSLAELNDRLAACCRAEFDRQLRGKSGTKGQRLEEERPRLLALPDEAFEARRIVTTRANSLSLVRFDRNDYSVPVAWAHHALTVVGSIETVRVLAGSEVVAEHPRDWGREAVRYDPVHYLALLERRPGALDVARPLEAWDLPPCFGILRRRLEAEWPRGSQGTRRFIGVLRLLEHATVGELKRAVQRALELGTHTADAVKVILEGQRETPLAMFSLDGRPHLAHVRVAEPDLAAYAVLTATAEGGAA
jgi:transposase